MTIKVTLEFATQEELLAYFGAAKTAPAQAKVESPKSEKAEASSKSEKSASPSTAATSDKVTDPKPETAVAATAPAPAVAQTASSGAGMTEADPIKVIFPDMTEADLTKVIVAAVARTSRDQVLGLLSEKFNVTAGKQITDPAVRKQAKQALEAL